MPRLVNMGLEVTEYCLKFDVEAQYFDLCNRCAKLYQGQYIQNVPNCSEDVYQEPEGYLMGTIAHPNYDEYPQPYSRGTMKINCRVCDRELEQERDG